MTKHSEKAPTRPSPPALALSRGLFGAPATRATHEKAPPPGGDGALLP